MMHFTSSGSRNCMNRYTDVIVLLMNVVFNHSVSDELSVASAPHTLSLLSVFR